MRLRTQKHTHIQRQPTAKVASVQVALSVVREITQAPTAPLQEANRTLQGRFVPGHENDERAPRPTKTRPRPLMIGTRDSRDTRVLHWP